MRKFKIYHANTPQGLEKQVNDFVEHTQCILIGLSHIEMKATMSIIGVIYDER